MVRGERVSLGCVDPDQGVWCYHCMAIWALLPIGLIWIPASAGRVDETAVASQCV